MRGGISPHRSSGSPEVVMHIWDCGGRPVFLDIISTFLTSRTILFDSSVELENKYQEKWHHKGDVIPGKYQNITYLQLMKQLYQRIWQDCGLESGLQAQALVDLLEYFDLAQKLITISRRHEAS